MSGLNKRKADEINDGDEAVAEAELQAAIAAAAAAPAEETILGLGSGVAPIHFKVPGITPAPWEYTTHPDKDEKPLMFAYLNIRGLGEVPRLMLAEAGAAYDHVAVTMAETQAKSLEWRSRSAGGLMPMLSGLGIPRSAPISQSGAIIRFIARKYGMNGRNEVEAAMADTLYETAKDFSSQKKLVTDCAPANMSEHKSPGPLGQCMEKMLFDMHHISDDSKPMNYGQIQLLHVLIQCDEEKPGCVAKLNSRLDEFRASGVARPRIAAYLASPMRFPLTCNEKNLSEGGYKYAEGKRARRDFAL